MLLKRLDLSDSKKDEIKRFFIPNIDLVVDNVCFSVFTCPVV